MLYNEETLSPSDIVHIVVHFIGKFPELFAWFKNSVGYKDATPTDQGRKNRMGELEINYASCKRYGASYRAHPANYVPPRCMGRTDLCKQVHHCYNPQLTIMFHEMSDQSSYIDYHSASFALHYIPRATSLLLVYFQVLNDTWRSYPCWSEDSTFSGSKKTQYEEYINKCDDER